MKYTKVSNGMLTDALIPVELKEFVSADEYGLGSRTRFKPDQQITMSFSDLEDMVMKAREFGNNENDDALTKRYLNSIGLIPVIKNECLLENIAEHHEDHVECWMSL